MPSVKILNKFKQKLIKRVEKRKKLAEMEKNSPEDKELIYALKDEISKKETKKIAEETVLQHKKTEEIKQQEEEIKIQNEKDQKILNDENAFPQDKEAAEERIAQRNEELSSLQTQIQEREEAMPLREKIKEIF